MRPTRRLFRNARSRFFKNSRSPRRASVPRRQKVRFRRRYATARLKLIGEIAWIGSRLAVVVGVVVWSAALGWNAWKSAEFLRVTSVRFEGDVPARLPGTFPVRAGDGLFSFNARNLRADARKRFPELDSLEIHRRFDRGVTVHGRYRTPIAMVAAPVPTAVAEDGVSFPVPPTMKLPDGLPVIDAPAARRPDAVAALKIWREKLPAFFDVVKKLETDKLRTFRVEVSDGVIVEWGDLDPATVVDKGRNVLRLMEFFSPGRTPARLRFVTDDRIVMDANWHPAGSKTREGDNLVKT